MNVKKYLPFSAVMEPWRSLLYPLDISSAISSAKKRIEDYNQNKISFSSYNKDVRANWQKAYDLIEGWFFEDLLCLIINESLKEKGYKALVIGSDKDRVIKEGSTGLSTDPDIGIFNDQGELVRAFELKVATEMWQSFHVKEGNARELKKHKADILFWLVKGNKLSLLNLKDFDSKELMANKSWGGKKCYEFSSSEMSKKIIGAPQRLDWFSFCDKNLSTYPRAG